MTRTNREAYQIFLPCFHLVPWVLILPAPILTAASGTNTAFSLLLLPLTPASTTSLMFSVYISATASSMGSDCCLQFKLPLLLLL